MITFRQMRDFRDVLFASGPEYQVPRIFTGRAGSRNLINEALNSKDVKVVVLSDLRGSGKTFTMQMVISDQMELGTIRSDEGLIVSIRAVANLVGTQHSATHPFLIVDEVDIKNPLQLLQKQLETVSSALADRFDKIVLVGDYYLRNKQMLQDMYPQGDIAVVSLEPLDRPFFLEAIANRAKYYRDFSESFDPSQELFDNDFLRCIVPDMKPPNSVFREPLSIIAGVCSMLPLSDESCIITGAHFATWIETQRQPILKQEQLQFAVWLKEYIITQLSESKPLKELTTSELRRLCPVKEVLDDTQYEEDILEPLVKAEILQSLGIPFKDGSGNPRRWPGPYQPTIRTILRAKYKKNWPYTSGAPA